MDRVTVRSMRPDEIDQVIAVISAFSKTDATYAKRYYERHLAGLEAGIPRLDAEVLIACAGRRIVGVSGFLQSDEWDDVYWLGWTYVHPSKQRSGIGSALLRRVERALRSRGCRKLLVDTSSHKAYVPALGFYRRLRFRLVAIISDYYGRGEDQLILAKDL